MLAAAMLGMPLGARAAVDDLAWLRADAAPSASAVSGVVGQANRLNLDPRFTEMLRHALPQKQFFWYDHWKLTALPEMIQTFIAVPGDAILDDNRYVTTDGCAPHICDVDRGMVWIDTGAQPPIVVFAAINPVSGHSGKSESHLWIYSSAKLNWTELPRPFRSSVQRWLATIAANGYRGTQGYRFHFLLATLVQPNGVMVDLEPAVLQLNDIALGAGAGL